MAATTVSGDLLDVEATIEASGIGGAFMIDSKMADISASSLKSFADER